MRIASLGSGSRGNATLVQHKTTTLLIDNGFSLRQFCKRLEKLDLLPSDIDGLLLTHEHGDHSSGVAKLCVSHNVPVWTAVGTARAALPPELQFETLVSGKVVLIGDIEVLPVTVPHDAREPLQFILRQSKIDNETQKRVGVLTDTGHITDHIVEAFGKLDGLLLEFNYDHQMLQNGPYPDQLKQRVGGNLGHLSNTQSLELLRRIDVSGLSFLIAGHISEKNNCPTIVAEMIQQIEGLPAPILANQGEGFNWVSV